MQKIKKNKLVKAWVNQHINDHYVNLSKQHGYRSRAVYKLLEIDNEVRLFDNVQTVIDLGCAPGSWSQYAVKRVGGRGVIVGVDLLELDYIKGVEFIHGDFTHDEVLANILKILGDRPIDLIISDMSPNLSGIRSVDQSRMSYLIELVLDFAKDHLKVGGNCLIKIFHGGEFDAIVKLARGLFAQVVIRKPQASRSASSETYLLCKGKLLSS